MENLKNKLKNNYLKVIIISLGILGLVGLFLPYEKSIGSHKEYLLKYPDTMNVEEVKLTNKDAINISIMENLKVYQYAMNNSNDEWLKGESIINFVLTIVLIVSIILVILFTLLNKRILTIIFDILLAISSLMMNYDIVSRGVIPSSKYTYGISYYLYIVISIIVLISTIVLIFKNKKKKIEKVK